MAGAALRRPSNMTYTLLGLNIFAYIAESVLSGNPIYLNPYVLAIMGQQNKLVFSGWWWQLFTSMFVHANIMHITMNMFFLWLLGIQYERIFGGDSLLYTYILSGLAGNILTLFLLPPWIVSVGASGAIFGIFGALILFNARVTGNIKYYLLYGLLIFLVNSTVSGVNVFAHLGGMVVGMLIGDYYGKHVASYFRRGVHYY